VFFSPANAQENTGAERVRSEIKIFSLKHVNALQVQQSLKELYKDEFQSAANTLTVDDRQNILVVRGRPDFVIELEAVVEKLDRGDTPATADFTKPGDSSPGSGPAGGSRVLRPQRNARGGRFTPELRQLEVQTRRLADQFREATVEGGGNTQLDQSKRDAMKDALRKAVEATFRARESWQRRQIAEMRDRLDEIEKNVDARGQRANEIIDRRVDDLLNPDRLWEITDGEPPVTDLPGLDEADPQTKTQSVKSSPRGGDPTNSVDPTLFEVKPDPRVSPRFGPVEFADPRKELLFAENAVTKAKSAIQEAEIAADASAKMFVRIEKGYKEGAVSEIVFSEREREVQLNRVALSRAQAELDAMKRVLELAKEHLIAQTKLAELELKEASVRWHRALDKDKQTSTLYEKKVISLEERNQAKAALDEAAVAVERAQAVYDLYQKALPK
jgi:hypothetical protein